MKTDTHTKNKHEGTFLIEPMQEKSLKVTAEFMVKLWPDSNYDTELELCKRLLRSKDEIIFTGKLDNKYLGFVYASLRSDYVEGCLTSPVGYVEGVFIEPDYRNLGFARKLVQKCEEWSANQGCSEFASDADLSNAMSQKFHEKLGFIEASRSVNFIKKLDKR